ncbi:MAG: hypothetical protein K4305_11190 [Chlorobium sp.]
MLHCEMLRGIEGNSIVEGDEDRLFFGLRVGKAAAATGMVIYARNK